MDSLLWGRYKEMLSINDFIKIKWLPNIKDLVELMGVQTDKKLRPLHGMYIISYNSISSTRKRSFTFAFPKKKFEVWIWFQFIITLTLFGGDYRLQNSSLRAVPKYSHKIIHDSDRSSVRSTTIFKMSAQISKFGTQIRVQLQEGKPLLRNQHQSLRLAAKCRATLPRGNRILTSSLYSEVEISSTNYCIVNKNRTQSKYLLVVLLSLMLVFSQFK